MSHKFENYVASLLLIRSSGLDVALLPRILSALNSIFILSTRVKKSKPELGEESEHFWLNRIESRHKNAIIEFFAHLQRDFFFLV